MKNQQVIILAGMLPFMLFGCGNGAPTPGPLVSEVDRVFSADPDGDSESITNAAALGTGIDSIFGGENSEPVPVNPGDTIGDILDRARNG